MARSVRSSKEVQASTVAATPGQLTNDQIKQMIIELGPWHIDVQVTRELSTAAFLEAPVDTYTGEKAVNRVSFIQPRDAWVTMMRRLYPDGLQGRSFMECACNCGAYCFWAKEMGASTTYGFDVREHWINQAKFLQKHRTWPSDGMRFEVQDVYDLPKSGLEPFDIVMFQGIFYHLPDPITALKGAADLAKEIILLDTAIRTDLPDGMLAIAEEGREQVMTGVYGLNWFPTGPMVLERVLHWLGFPETCVVHWRKKRVIRLGRSGFGRIRVLGARTPGTLRAFRSLDEPIEIETDRSKFRGSFDKDAIAASSFRKRRAKERQ